MASKSAHLTEGELRIMRVLWARPGSTVLDIQAALRGDRLEESSIRTFLAILERKDMVRRHKQGRAFVYEATADRATMRRRALHQFIHRFFNSPGDLVLNVLDAEELDEAEIERLQEILKRRKRAKS